MAFVAFTEQEKTAANEADIVTYLQAQGESVTREGQEYAWQAPSGKVSIRGNQWYSQYEQTGGATVSFVRKFYGLTFPDAIKSILGIRDSYKPETGGGCAPLKKAERKEFVLPTKHSNMRRVYAYLIKDRFIDKEVIHDFAHRELIYEDDKSNVVFVGCDSQGTPRHAQKRSTNPVSSFKQNVAGSAAEYSFHHVGTSDRLYVFEAPIDMLAYISMNKMGWKEHSYVALASTADRAAIQMLRDYPHIKTVYLCLDHDSAGIEGAYRVAESIHELGDWPVWRLFPKNKDWDEDLKERNGREPIPASEHPKAQYVAQRCEELLQTDPQRDYIFVVLSKAKGYLVDDAFEKMKLLLEKLDQVEKPKKKQQQLINICKVALSLVVLRNKQLGNNVEWGDVIYKMKEYYRPHYDNGVTEVQLQSLKRGFVTLEQAMKMSKTFTQQDICCQNDAVLRFGLYCICAAGAIDREINQKEGLTIELQ